MNRRQFFTATAGVLLTPLVPIPKPPSFWECQMLTSVFKQQYEPLTFKGMQLAFDKCCPTNSIYFLTPKYLVCSPSVKKAYEALL